MAVGPETTEARSESRSDSQTQQPHLLVDGDEVGGEDERSQISRDDTALLVRFSLRYD